jgi:hypothetical protein
VPEKRFRELLLEALISYARWRQSELYPNATSGKAAKNVRLGYYFKFTGTMDKES